MGYYSQKMERARVFRIGVADDSVEALGVGQMTGAMMSNRSCEYLFGTAPSIHGDSRLSISRKTDIFRGQDQSRRGCRKPRRVDRKAARGSSGTACCMRCSGRDG